MDFGISLAVGVLVSGAMIAVSMLMKPKLPAGMKPAGLDSFGPTQSSEGIVIPFVRGRVRLPGTLLWYGNLTTTEAKAEVGGKGMGMLGGGGGGTSQGYHYYLDVWQAICQGPGVSLVKVYIDDVEKTLADLGTYEFNDGDDGTYPTEPGTYAGPLPGIAHIFLPQYYVGLNRTQLPTIHFVYDVLSTAPITGANMSNGVNPAALVYDILIESEVSAGDIDLTAFQTAADIWTARGYGLNVYFTEQKEARAWIDDVFTMVDGCLRMDENDRYVLKAYTSGETVVADGYHDIPETAFNDFDFKRRLYTETYSDYRATFKDEDQAFSERVVRARQGAVRRLLGYNKPHSIDLTAFRDGATASKRIHEIMEKMSYPEGQIDCSLPMRYAGIEIGDVVTITNSQYGLTAERYRCHEKSPSAPTENSIKFRFIQAIEDIAADTNYADGGFSEWVAPSYAPVVLSNQRVFELPYNGITGVEPAFLLLAARAGVETAFAGMVSYTGSDYTMQSEFTTFSQCGALGETYIADTLSIDDEVGILYTPAREDPVFDTISRTDLFMQTRCAIIGDEMIAFQRVVPEGPSAFRLLGCIRGILNTPVTAHLSGSAIWLTTIQNNVMRGVTAGSFYMKLLPSFGTKRVALALATAIPVTSTVKAATPWPLTRIEVVKSGSTNTVTIWPTTQLYEGAGVRSAAMQTDKENPDYTGTFDWYTSAVTAAVEETDPSFTVTQAGAFILYVRANISGACSEWSAVTVGAGNGTYIGPEI